MKAIWQGIITNSTKTQLEKLEQYLEEINTKITLENAKEKFTINRVLFLKQKNEPYPKQGFNSFSLVSVG